MTPSTLLFCDTDDGSSFPASIVVDCVLNKTTSNNSQRVVMKPQQPEGSYEIMIYIYLYNNGHPAPRHRPLGKELPQRSWGKRNSSIKH